MIQTIKDCRNTLEDTIFNRVPLDQLQWRDLAGHETEVFRDHKAQAVEVLVKEQQYMRISGRLVKPLEKNLLEQVIGDLRNLPEFVKVDDRLHKGKYFVNLVFAADKSQADPQYGQNPLHVAAIFDIAMPAIKENAYSDLTRFTLEAMGDYAGPAIEHVNWKNENILHLAIQNHLVGVKELIQAAGQAAFRQRRGPAEESAQHLHGHGNTPLHDALELRHFMAKVPACPVGGGVGGEETRLCDACQKADQNNQSALSERCEIIDALLKKDLSVLTIQNSAGLPPYVFLRLACGKDDDLRNGGLLPRSGCEHQQEVQHFPPQPLTGSTNNNARDTAPTQFPPVVAPLPSAGVATTSNNTLAEKLQNLGIEVSFDTGPKPPLATPGLEGGEMGRVHHPQKLGSRVVRRSMKDPASGAGASVDQEAEGWDNTSAAGEQAEHSEDQLKEADIGSDIILGVLREKAYRLGSYDDTRKALFSRHIASSSSVFDSRSPFSASTFLGQRHSALAKF